MFGFASAFPLYVASSYFEEAIGHENVSIFYLLIFGGVFGALLLLPRAFRYFSGISLFLVLLFGVGLVHAPLLFFPVSHAGAFFLVWYFLLVTVGWTILDTILENFSEDRFSGRIRSIHLSAMNLGLLIAPFLSTQLLTRYGFSGVFSASLILFSLLFTLFLVFFSRVPLGRKKDISSFSFFGRAFRRPDILRIYAISCAMEFFYAVMIVYMPLRLRELSMDWSDIGIVFTIMLLPFVVIQYPLGLLADRKTGEKELLLGSIFLAAVSTALVGFLESSNVVLWAGVLFSTRLGIAAIEVLRDSYFYKRIGSNDADLIAFFRTASPVGNILAAVILGIALFFVPLSLVFFLPAALLFLSLVPALSLEDNRSDKENANTILRGAV
ncbi:MAG: MFS transporter [Candidatus Moraniibacteriota bacterium]|nr:MAG: MFS transporter [Candidatus Moranbacteria bacterium]